MKDAKNTVKTKEEVITKLIAMLRRDDLSVDHVELIQGMLLENRADADTEKVLRQAFDGILRYKAEPSAETRRMLAELRVRLGMEPAKRKRSLFLRAWPMRAAVAVLALLLAVGALMWMNSSEEATTQIAASWISVSAIPGTVDEIILPDSSAVRLHGNSTLEYSENFSHTRRVRLNGEAFFRVTKDAEHPFTVDAGGLVVKVLGTEFNVAARADGGETAVTLASGSVEVEANGRKTKLQPMNRLVVRKLDGELSTGRVDVAEIDALRLGMLRFENILLGDALRRAGQYYGIGIDIPEGFGSDRMVRVAFDAEDGLDDLLFALRAATGLFDYEITSQGVRITEGR